MNPKTKRVSRKATESIWIRVTPELKKWISKQAVAEERSINSVVRRLIEKAKKESQ